MGTNYKDAGVDIDAANELISNVKEKISSTHNENVLAGIGGFASCMTLGSKYEEPVLVSGTDGVGTKLLLANELGKHKTIGKDLVAMCVNDVITSGAQPLFFLDYLAAGKLGSLDYSDIVGGIADACKEAGCALVGGETAELPGMYKSGDYDLAGFCVGVVDKSALLDGSKVKAGDKMLALPSSGFHSNGYSLIRKIIHDTELDLSKDYGFGKSLGDILIEPTNIYTGAINTLMKKRFLSAAAHITGGGLIENTLRVLPKGTRAVFKGEHLPEAKVFRFIGEKGGVDEDELYRTFNMGIGMVLIVASGLVDMVLKDLDEAGWPVLIIGDVLEGEHGGAIE